MWHAGHSGTLISLFRENRFAVGDRYRQRPPASRSARASSNKLNPTGGVNMPNARLIARSLEVFDDDLDKHKEFYSTLHEEN